MQDEKMKILLTNDDGYSSEGIQALFNALKEDHEVVMVAPEGEKSACSHQISIKNHVVIKKQGEGQYSCSGSPADCVIQGLLGDFIFQPDIVISGINRGPNLGTDIIYSGTCAAARQAALMHRPAVAVSMANLTPPWEFESAARFIAMNVESFLEHSDEDHFLNINVPNVWDSQDPVAITTPARRYYKDRIESFVSPLGHVYAFMAGSLHDISPKAGSDWAAVEMGKISVSSIYIHPVNHDNAIYQKVKFRIPEHE